MINPRRVGLLWWLWWDEALRLFLELRPTWQLLTTTQPPSHLTSFQEPLIFLFFLKKKSFVEWEVGIQYDSFTPPWTQSRPPVLVTEREKVIKKNKRKIFSISILFYVWEMIVCTKLKRPTANSLYKLNHSFSVQDDKLIFIF